MYVHLSIYQSVCVLACIVAIAISHWVYYVSIVCVECSVGAVSGNQRASVGGGSASSVGLGTGFSVEISALSVEISAI